MMRATVIAFAIFSVVISSRLEIAVAADLTPAEVWMTDFAAAEAQAKALNRPLVVHFYAPWCGPCKQMERQVLNTPQFLKTLDEGFVAVKVNSADEKTSRFVARFKVTSLPTDLVISPEGKILMRLDKGFSAADKPIYLAHIANIDSTYKRQGTRLPRPSSVAEKSEPQKSTTVREEIATATPSNNRIKGPDRLVPEPVEPKIIPEGSEEVASQAPVDSPVTETPKVHIALDGYCPVTLRMTRTWKKGEEEFTTVHQGMTYHLLGKEQLEAFQKNPSKFVPRLLGCDAVALTENDLAIPGSTKFGAFYDGDLFLFENGDARTKFKKNPTRYTRVRHVLKPEDINGPRLTSRQ